jgi:hypothetical protein
LGRESKDVVRPTLKVISDEGVTQRKMNMSITWSESISPDGTVRRGRIRKVKSGPRTPSYRRRTIRLPKGASWIRFEDDLGTHLLYHGVRWGYVYKPKPRVNLKNPYKWYSENAYGNINWGKSKDEVQRQLVRTLWDELKKVRELMSQVHDLVVTGKYRKLSHRDLLRWKDEYKAPSGKWLSVYGPATGSVHTIGLHPYPGTEYRRPT